MKQFSSLILSLIISVSFNIISAQTVKIGTQEWTTENLNVDKFQNGDSIPEAKSFEEWVEARENNQPAWCYYENDSTNGKKFGKLYNWYAVNDPRGLAPKGYCIPSVEEWSTLFDFFGGEKVAGRKMKSTESWIENGNGNDSLGFNGKAGGGRGTYANFGKIGEDGIWWCSDGYSGNANYHGLNYKIGKISPFDTGPMGCGFSVRCLKEQETVTIGSQVWMTKNLNLETFRNGDSIPHVSSDEEWIAAGENKQPAWCYYDNDPINGVKYGKLYNWYAVNDPRGLAPEGFHIPSSLDSLKQTLFRASAQDSLDIRTGLLALINDFKTTQDDLNFAIANSDSDQNEVYFNSTLSNEFSNTFTSEIDNQIKSSAKGSVLGPYLIDSDYYLFKISDTIFERGLCNARHILISDKVNGRKQLENIKKTILQKGNFKAMAKLYSDDTGSGSTGGDLGWFKKGDMVPSFDELCFSAKKGELKIVETPFGWHLVEVLDFAPCMKVTQIVKNINPSFETFNKSEEIIAENINHGEWEMLFNFLGEEAAFKLKSKTGWDPIFLNDTTLYIDSSNYIENGELSATPADMLIDGNGNNSSGFNARPGGFRNQYLFEGIGENVFFWCKNDFSPEIVAIKGLGNNEILEAFSLKSSGYYVRCIKD